MDGKLAVDFSSFITALTGTITPADILAILAQCVGVGVAFVLMWMGAKKLVSSFVSAVTKGRFKM